MGTNISGGTFKHIEGELYAYHDTIKEMERIRKDIILASDKSYDAHGGSKVRRVKDPTGETATILITHRRLTHMEEITKVITDVYECLPKEKQDLVQLLYWQRPRELTWDGIAKELNVSKRTAHRWRKQIISEIAKRLGWR